MSTNTQSHNDTTEQPIDESVFMIFPGPGENSKSLYFPTFAGTPENGKSLYSKLIAQTFKQLEINQTNEPTTQ